MIKKILQQMYPLGIKEDGSLSSFLDCRYTIIKRMFIFFKNITWKHPRASGSIKDRTFNSKGKNDGMKILTLKSIINKNLGRKHTSALDRATISRLVKLIFWKYLLEINFVIFKLCNAKYLVNVCRSFPVSIHF